MASEAAEYDVIVNGRGYVFVREGGFAQMSEESHWRHLVVVYPKGIAPFAVYVEIGPDYVPENNVFHLPDIGAVLLAPGRLFRLSEVARYYVVEERPERRHEVVLREGV